MRQGGSVAARTSFSAAALTALAVAITALVVAVHGRAADEPPSVRSPEPAPAAVLAHWDESRAAAWASGDVRALAALYTPTSSAGHRDTAMLRRYLRRGLRVDGLAMQRTRVQVTARDPRRWVLEVQDRVVHGVVVGPGTRARLPRDRLSDHLVTMRRVGGAWRVAKVEPVRPARQR